MRYTYTVDYIRHYTPDTVIGEWTIELKGRFRTIDEAKKYLHIRKEVEGQFGRFMFVFFGKNVAMPGARLRKDGTKRTMEEWATENNFDWIYEEDLKKWLATAKGLSTSTE